MPGDSCPVYLLGESDLDRQAYRLLLQNINVQLAAESGFAPVEVWSAMRATPAVGLIIASRCYPEIRDAIQLIRRLRRQTRILVAGGAVDEIALKDWGRCAPDGYVVKAGGLEELSDAIRAVCTRGSYHSAGVREILDAARQDADGLQKLSRREVELLPLLARGLTLRDAAAKLAVSYKTADSYRTSLMRKLGVKDRVELARLAIRERIIEP